MEGGRRFEHATSSLDIFPPALAAAGVHDLDAFDLDGVNLLPFLDGTAKGAPHEYLVWRSGPNAAVRKGQWKLIRSEGGPTRLYNLDKDPGESVDHSDEQPALLVELEGVLEEWAEDNAEPREGTRRAKTDYNGDLIDWHI